MTCPLNYSIEISGTQISVKVHLPGITSANEIVLETSKGRVLHLQTQNALRYNGCINLPFQIDENSCAVSFKKKSQQLVLRAVQESSEQGGLAYDDYKSEPTVNSVRTGTNSQIHDDLLNPAPVHETAVKPDFKKDAETSIAYKKSQRFDPKADMLMTCETEEKFKHDDTSNNSTKCYSGLDESNFGMCNTPASPDVGDDGADDVALLREFYDDPLFFKLQDDITAAHTRDASGPASFTSVPSSSVDNDHSKPAALRLPAASACASACGHDGPVSVAPSSHCSTLGGRENPTSCGKSSAAFDPEASSPPLCSRSHTVAHFPSSSPPPSDASPAAIPIGLGCVSGPCTEPISPKPDGRRPLATSLEKRPPSDPPSDSYFASLSSQLSSSPLSSSSPSVVVAEASDSVSLGPVNFYTPSTMEAEMAAGIDVRYVGLAMHLRGSFPAASSASRAARAKEKRKTDEILGRVVNYLEEFGYAVLDNYIPVHVVEAVLSELHVMRGHYSPGMIWVGKEAAGGAEIKMREVRGDVVLWLDAQALLATAFEKDGVRRQCCFVNTDALLAMIDALVFEELRPRVPALRHLHMRTDAMTTIYPGKGARFAKHVDNSTRDGRRLTVVAYLNPGWRVEQGGAIRLFPQRKSPTPVDAHPFSGRLALFFSDEVPHEVMPAYENRSALTLWYYDAVEHAECLAGGKLTTAVPPAAREAAQALLTDLLADVLEASDEGCRTLAARVALMSDAAVAIVAAVTGAPNPVTFRESMAALTPYKLTQLRHELRSMGLDTQHHQPNTDVYS